MNVFNYFFTVGNGVIDRIFGTRSNGFNKGMNILLSIFLFLVCKKGPLAKKGSGGRKVQVQDHVERDKRSNSPKRGEMGTESCGGDNIFKHKRVQLTYNDQQIQESERNAKRCECWRYKYLAYAHLLFLYNIPFFYNNLYLQDTLHNHSNDPMITSFNFLT